MHSSVRIVVAAGLLLSAVLPLGARDRAQVYATVVDAAKAPVTGLGTADFVLRDGGTRLGVLNAAPATDPMSVAIVVSGFDAGGMLPVRKAIEDLVRTMGERNPGSRMGLVIRDVALRSRVTMLPADAAVLGAAIAALAPATGSSQDAVDGIIAACDALREAPADRRTVLAIVQAQAGDGNSSSRARLVDAIIGARAALWTVEVAPAPSGAPKPLLLEDALAEGVRTSGALREKLSTGGDVPAATARIAGRWLSQYLVTYTWPEPMVSQFSLTTRHDAGEVLTPAWTR